MRLLNFNIFVDANEIQKFVTVALTTAAGGENDYAHDRLSNLRIVGSGYSPLIYSLPQNASFTDFKRACVSVWNSLDSNPMLPELLVSLCYFRMHYRCKHRIYYYRNNATRELVGIKE